MLSEKYLKMTQLSSSIGLAYEASLKRAAEIGSENVFDYSIGNPSVPAPEQFADAIVDIVRHVPHAELHSYCHSGGAPALREAIVADLNARFGMQYRPEDIFI
ncbi:MAG: pyridoxal phosphate-dependent aminotransferase, partial [Clostridiales bacterium]|nr:pyridoxal phosphate-dependent aminotransferase [Clostridiales bacterium]